MRRWGRGGAGEAGRPDQVRAGLDGPAAGLVGVGGGEQGRAQQEVGLDRHRGRRKLMY